MIGALSHRGPDGGGIHLDGPVGLAHARLAILDLAGGAQPMANEDRSLWITFNGEIFNYLELRDHLLARGHRFATHSDTEVILHLYEDQGPDCVKSLNGQWAFAIWDSRSRTLFLSRDRTGVRPLHYTLAGGAFLFASEIKSLLAHPAVRREIDVEALDEIFTFWCTLPPRTIFRDVFELPAGHSMTVRDGDVRVERYWEPAYDASREPAVETDGRAAALASELRELLVDAVRLRLRSDVPVGAYLSGGLDSTFIIALIRRFTTNPLKTFSVTFDDAQFDESRWQSEAVRFLQTDHRALRCSAADIARVFPDVIRHTEKPVLRTAPAPLYLLSRAVRGSGHKVVLTGEGSDELFGGYDIFKEAKIRRFWAAQPDSRLRPLLLKRLYPYLPQIQAQPGAYLKAFFEIGSERAVQPFFSHLPRWLLTSKLKALFSDDVKAQLEPCGALRRMEAHLPAAYCCWDWLARAQFLETAHLLPGYILSSQGDRVAMAHAVEGRFPFLDYRVVEFAAKLPPRLKMRVLDEKYLVKLAARGLVPPAVIGRHKQPYRAPEAACFFGPGGEYADELLSPQRIAQDGLFHPAGVEKLAAKVRRGQAIGIKDNMALVGILSTQLLVQHFIRQYDRRS